MPAPSRPHREPTDDWQQLDMLVQFPEQRTYELIRPVVLFGNSPAERARQTDTPARTLSRWVARFVTYGMASSAPDSDQDPSRKQALQGHLRLASPGRYQM